MVQRYLRKLLFSRTVRNLIKLLDAIVLPGFRGVSLYQILIFFARALRNGRIVTRASAISFKLFLAFFPGIILLLTLIPFIPIPDLQSRILETFAGLLPNDVYVFIEGLLVDLVQKRGTLLSFSFLVVLWLASNSMNAILAGFGGSMNLERKRNALRQRLWSILLLLGLAFMLFLAVLLITTSDAVLAFLAGKGFSLGPVEWLVVGLAKWLVVILLISGSISMLFNVGNTEATQYKWLSPGVILSTLLIILASQLLVYVFNNFTDYNALYGSIGAIIAVQVWIYVNIMLLLIGFELDTSITSAGNRARHTLRLGDKEERE